MGAAAGCFEFSPHQVPGGERGRLQQALDRLQARPEPAVLRFAVVGDTQYDFDEARDAVRSLKRRDDLDFVVQVGDFTHHAIASEFRLMSEVFDELRVPWFVVVGIHDLLGNGEFIFEELFGPDEFAFSRGGLRFVLFNSNSREYGFDGTVPDLGALRSALESGDGLPAVLFSHVAPSSVDFDPALRAPLEDLFRSRAVASFHGHEHRFRVGEEYGLPAWVADAVEHRSYLVATANARGGLDVEKVDF